jgi:2-methylcitrate dehydratase PrpD
MALTSRICQFVVNTEYEDIPSEVIGIAKRCILDCFGVMIRGSVEKPSKILVDYSRSIGGNPESTVVGCGLKTSCLNTALVNGTMAHILDYDDVNLSMLGHPTAPVLPAALSIGERNRIHGKDLLTAFVLGFEVECKIGAALNPGHYKNWHTTKTLGTLGSAAAVGKMLDLSTKEMTHAFGIAGSLASGLKENFGTMTKSLHAGLAAEAGVKAALLAKQQFTSATEILEGEMGFVKVFSDRHDMEKVGRNLGQPYDMLIPGVVFKQYASCSATHSAIDATIFLVKEYDINPNEVATVECGTGLVIPDCCIHPSPENGLEGKFSVPFCIAVALLDRQVNIEHFLDQKVKDQEVQRVMRRVKTYVHPELAKRGYNESAIVTLKMKDGREYSHEVEVARGNPEKPLTQDEIVAKFRLCTANILNENTQKLADSVTNIERMDDVSQIMRFTYA